MELHCSSSREKKRTYSLRELKPASTDEMTSDSHLPNLAVGCLFSLGGTERLSKHGERDSHDGPGCATSKSFVVVARAGGRRCERNLEHAPGPRGKRCDQSRPLFAPLRSSTGGAVNPIAISRIGGHTYLKSTTKALPDVLGLLEAATMAATTSSIVGRGIPARRSEVTEPKMLVLTNCEGSGNE